MKPRKVHTDHGGRSIEGDLLTDEIPRYSDESEIKLLSDYFSDL